MRAENSGAGPRFVDDHGPVKVKIVTAFDWLRRFSVREYDALRAYARWTLSVGGNGVRVFAGWQVTGLDFRNVPNFFDVLHDCCAFTRDEGLQLLLTCVCDRIPDGASAQADFISRCADVLIRFDHCLGEKSNEAYNGNSEFPPSIHAVIPSGLMFAQSACRPGADPASGDPNDAPYLPSLGFTSYESDRSPDWYRKVGKDGYEIRGMTHDVTMQIEPMGAADHNEPGRRSCDPHEFFTAGGAAGLFQGSVVGHGDSHTMQLCNVPPALEARCISELFRGLDFVPIAAPTWLYARYGPSAPPVPMPCEPDPIDGNGDDVRMHAMVGPNEAVTVNYRYWLPGHDAWTPQGVNGWTTAKQDGPLVISKR